MAQKSKGKGGRPTLYSPKVCELLVEYFSIKPYAISRKTYVASDFPSFAGFAAKINVHRDTLDAWKSAHPEFSDSYKRAKELQEHWLLTNLIKGTIQAAPGIFTLKNACGYREKQPGEQDTFNINVTLADKMAKARARGKNGKD